MSGYDNTQGNNYTGKGKQHCVNHNIQFISLFLVNDP